MSGIVGLVDKASARNMIVSAKQGVLSEFEVKTLNEALEASAFLWGGVVDGKLVCVWGVIPPTILSTTAYLWLFDIDIVENRFTFIRQSRIVLQHLLDRFPLIVGVVKADNAKSQRWLKWLGATFSYPTSGGLIPFEIRKPNHG